MSDQNMNDAIEDSDSMADAIVAVVVVVVFVAVCIFWVSGQG